MTAILIALLFAATGLLVIGSLADSAVRGRNAWRTVRREMSAELSRDVVDLRADVVAFRDIRPLHHSRKAKVRISVNDQLAAAA